jgi:hypothetical protein
MPFSTILLSGATVGMTTLAFAIAAPASAQEQYAHKHYAHTHYAHPRYRHYAHYHEGRQIVVHAQEPVPVQAQGYAWGPAAAVGNVVVGTGQAVQGVFTGAGAVVGGILGGVFGGTAALFGYPYNPTPSYAYSATPSYAYGAPFAAPFNAAGGGGGFPVPGGGRRFRRFAGRPPRLLSHFRLYHIGSVVERSTRSHQSARVRSG